MKLNKVALISAIAIAGIGLSACSSNSAKNGNSVKTTQTSKKKNNDQEKVISQNKELRAKFDQIKVGDLMKKGQGGSTEKQVEKLLGEPNSTDSSKTDGIKTSGATWNKENVSITVAYTDHNAVSKLITGFKWNHRPEKLTLKEFKAIKDGSSYESVVKKYGDPDGLDESLIMGQKTISATWFTGIKAKNAGSNVILTFTNNKLTNKTQTDLK